MIRDFADRITWVAVVDGEKSLILRNDDTDATPLLNVVDAHQIDNPPSRDQGAARPGRMNDGRAGSTRRSAFEETDFHRLAKDVFARDFAANINKAAEKGAFDRLVLFAPPQTLGELRPLFTADLKKRLVAEIDRDLTNHPVLEIERQVAAALAPS